MTQKAPCPMLLLLLLLAVAWLMVVAQDGKYKEFKNKHLDYPKTKAKNNRQYCNTMRQRRRLPCRLINTFIHVNEARMKYICRSGKRISKDTRESLRAYQLTDCIRARKGSNTQCRYRGKSSKRRIRVTCENGVPIHYVRT